MTKQDAIDYIKEVGFLPLFGNDIPGFSLEERTEPQFWLCGDTAVDPWEWIKKLLGGSDIEHALYKAGWLER